MASRTLTDLEKRMLAFEAKWEGRAGSKEHAVRTEFGWRIAAYEMRLQQLLKDPAAEAYDPMLVHRAAAVRARRSQQRAARTFRSVG